MAAGLSGHCFARVTSTGGRACAGPVITLVTEVIQDGNPSMFRFARGCDLPGPRPRLFGVSKAFGSRYAERGLVVAGARPHRWPAAGAAQPETTALLVVGAQRAVASQCVGASYVWETISTLVVALRSWGAKIAWARHARSPANAACTVLPPAHGPERGPAARLPGDLVALAYGVDGFSASPLAEGLRGLGTTHLVVAGFGLEGPVHSTLRTANDRGWECLLVADACAPFEPDLAAGALGMVEMAGGLFGVTAPAQALLVELSARAPHRGEHAV